MTDILFRVCGGWEIERDEKHVVYKGRHGLLLGFDSHQACTISFTLVRDDNKVQFDNRQRIMVHFGL
jgi:hypothetical protein